MDIMSEIDQVKGLFGLNKNIAITSPAIDYTLAVDAAFVIDPTYKAETTKFNSESGDTRNDNIVLEPISLNIICGIGSKKLDIESLVRGAALGILSGSLSRNLGGTVGGLAGGIAISELAEASSKILGDKTADDLHSDMARIWSSKQLVNVEVSYISLESMVVKLYKPLFKVENGDGYVFQLTVEEFRTSKSQSVEVGKVTSDSPEIDKKDFKKKNKGFSIAEDADKATENEASILYRGVNN